MKNRLKRRISAIIICACLLVSVVSVVGAANAAVPTAEVAAGEGNFLINGGFEADSALLSQSGEITLGWKLNGVTSATPALSQDSYEGEQSLKLDLSATDAAFTLIPSIADDNGKITNLKAGIYSLSFYVKGNAALSVKFLDADLKECTKTFNSACESITEWTKVLVPMGLGTTGRLQFTITPAEGTAVAGQSIFIDNVSLSLNTSVINGEFEREVTVPSTAGSLIADGDFENGTVNALSSSGNTVSVFESENGYGLKAYSYAGFFAEANTDAQYAHSGTRSLKIYTNTNKSQQYLSIAPEGATVKHGTKDVYFFENLESGTYTVKAYVKLPCNLDSDNTNDTRVLMRTFDWSTGNAVDTLNQSGITPDSNGWYCYEIDATVGADGHLGFSIYIDPTGSNANTSASREVYIDDISISLKPQENTLTPSAPALITNGDFEEGTVYSGVYSKAENSTRRKIFTESDGTTELSSGYHFAMVDWSSNNSRFAISTTEYLSGSRSLKIYGNTTTADTAVTVVPESASVYKSKHHYISGLEAGKYVLNFSFKETNDSGMVYLKSYKYSDSSELLKLRVDNNASYPADSKGWKTVEQEFTVGSDGYLNFEIYVANVSDTIATYLDNITLTKKAEINHVTNGDFEEGTVYSGVYGKAENSTRRKIFVGSDGTTQLDSGYHFVAVDYSGNNVKYAIDTANASSGTRSLKLYSSNTSTAGVNITAEGASAYKNKHHYFSGLPAGEYTLSFSFKETNDVGRIYVRSYRYSDETRVVNDRVDNDTTNYPADSKGWKHYTKELTVGSDGYLNFEIYVDSIGATDYTYFDNLRLIGDAPQSVTPPAPTEKDTDIPYWTTTADDAGKSVLSIVSDDTVSGDTALKITQNADKSIAISPKITKTSIGTGYNMLAFHAKGSGSIAVKIETDSQSFEDNIALEDSWNMYRIRDIEIKESQSVKKITFTVTGTALLDAVQFYAQAGPALLTESFTVISGNKRLCMPAVADGYKVALKSSSNADIISLDGEITEPEYNTAVEVVLSVTNINDSTDTADSHVFTVNVAGKKGQKPTAEYKQMTLTDSQTGVSVSAVMNSDSKFRAMAVGSDNKYYQEMLSEDMQSIAFYNTVLTPKGEHSSKLRFSFPVDSKYNGKTITVAYKGDGLDTEYLEAKAENGFVTVETDADGFFMLEIPVEKAAGAPSQGTTEKPADKAPDKPADEKPTDEPSKEPSTEVEQTDKQLSVEKLIDNTLIWIVIIVAAAVILIIIEITTTLLIKRKIKRS